MSRLKQVILFFILLISFQTVFAQSPYQYEWKKETLITATGFGLYGLGKYLENKTPLFTPDELITLDPNDVNAFDRVATGYNSIDAHNASDVFWHSSFVLPALFLTNKNTRRDIIPLGLMWTEAMALNAGVTVMFKGLFKRPRPFVFDETAEMDRKLVHNAKASFVSGHTSMTAASTFFMAKVYSDYFPDSKYKPVVWTLAATIPAVTGYLRVRGGRHYPTDVLAGYALGATIGILVPHWHRRKNKDSRLSFYGGTNSMLLKYRF